MAGSRIKGITVEIGGDVTGLEKALKSVNSTIKNTQSQLKDVERLLKLDPTHTELLSQKQALLKDSISATKEKLEALKTAQQQAKQQMENGTLGKDKYDALQREIIETEQELQRLAREAAEANTALTKIGEAGKTLENLGNKMTSVGSSLTRNVTVPLVAIGTAAVKTTADFDAEMSKVSAISGAAGEDFDALREKAREMGSKTKFSATEAAQGFEYMAMAGWKTEDMLEGIEGIMNLAAASGEDLATTSDIVTDALTAFGLSAKDSGHFADVLAAASSNANTNVSMLGESFKYAAPVAGALGISAEDTSVALGLMANAGIKASQAGTALRTGLTNLAKPTKQMQTYMDQYNIALVQNDDGSINLRETMISLREKMGDLSESEQAAAASAIFGKNSMAGWLAIINASDEDFDKLTSAIDNCDGSAEQMAATMQDNLAGQITILKSALQELMIQIGDSLMPVVRNIVSHIQSFVEKLQQMDEGTRNTIIRIAAFAAAIGPVLVVVGKLTTGVGQGLQAISNLGKGILTFVNEAKLGVGAGGKLATAIAGIGPVGWAVIAVVAALTAAFVHLWNTNEEFREKITAIWEGVKAKFAEAAEKITDAINSLGFNFKDLGEAIKAAWDWLCNALEPIVTGIIQNIANVISGLVDVVTGIVQVICGIIKGFKDGDWSLFLDGLKSLWEGVWNLLTAPVRAVINVISGYLDKFGTSWSEIWTGIKDFFVGVWEAIKEFFVSIWNGIVSFFTGVWNGLKDTVIKIGEAIRTAISNAWNAVKTTFENIWNGIKSFFSGVWDGIKNTVSTVMEGVKTTVSNGWNEVKSTTETIWNGTKSFVSSTWESIKSAVGGFVDGIKEKVSTVWTNIKTSVGDIMGGIKDKISEKWEAAKSAVSTVVDNIKSGVSEKWEATKNAVSTTVEGIKTAVSDKWTSIKDKVGGVVDTLKGAVSSKWESIKSDLGSKLSAISSDMSSKWETIKSNVGSKVDSIKSAVESKWSSIKSSISSAVSGITSNLSSGFQNAYSTVSSKFESIKSKITSVMDSAKSKVQSVIDNIRSKFNFSWSLPHLKMPHLSITGSFSINPPSVPHFSISWYKKAMENGMILNSPTIFGMKGSQLLAGGEAGSETVVGTKSLMTMIRDAVASMSAVPSVNYGGVFITVNAAEGQDEMTIARNVADIIQNQVGREAAVWA